MKEHVLLGHASRDFSRAQFLVYSSYVLAARELPRTLLRSAGPHNVNRRCFVHAVTGELANVKKKKNATVN